MLLSGKILDLTRMLTRQKTIWWFKVKNAGNRRGSEDGRLWKKTIYNLSQLFHLHEAPVGFKSLGDGRSASYPKNEDSVFCQHIVVPVSCRERSNRKKKMSSCHCQFGPVVVRRSLGHGSIGRISPQMGLQACMKKGRKGGVGCSSKQESRNI